VLKASYARCMVATFSSAVIAVSCSRLVGWTVSVELELDPLEAETASPSLQPALHDRPTGHDVTKRPYYPSDPVRKGKSRPLVKERHERRL
jgi:hypothetical protein